jgi:hypothetical protein
VARQKKKSKKSRGRNKLIIAAMIGAIVIISIAGYIIATRSESTKGPKPIILYVNQGNGVVNESNFGALVTFSTGKGFNTIFFQVYRSGVLLFNSSELEYFVSTAHAAKLRIFFSLYFTSSNETIPTSIYSLGEDGISLDMSTLDPSTQNALLSTLAANYRGTSAVTTTDFTTALRPDWLILETYGPEYDQYIRPGIIASVGVFTTTSELQYNQEFQYALNNSDGVMVFDYAGLASRGY